MLYLEDYLELVEHLPQETVDGLTDMRELDLQVQNSLDNIKKRVGKFFSNAYRMKSADLEIENSNIIKEYRKILEDTEEKMQIANTMTDSLGKYMRRLDQDILKFKIELEADNSGVTDLIEKRFEESTNEETPVQEVVSTSVERHRRRQTLQSYSDSLNKHVSASEPRRHDLSTVEQKFQKMTLPSASSSHSMFSNEQVGSTIVAAASQAIAATQQLQQGRRSASLKASYEAINAASPIFGRTSDICALNKELANAVSSSNIPSSSSHSHRRQRKRRGQNSRLAAFVEQIEPEEIVEPEPVEPDPDEPRYCICNEVAFGGMVACDNAGCPYEWYHYPCVGITEAPEGKWYCPQCTVTMKQRRRK